MSKYQEFCESLWVGKAKTEEEQLERQDEERTLPRTVGNVIQRLCQYFQCPAEQVGYVDTQANMVTGTLQDRVPPVWHDPQKGRYCLDFEMGIVGPAAQDQYPVWLHLEFVPLKHGGLEFHFGSASFRVPDEERALFNQVADAVNQELRKAYTPGPRRIGF
jgi:hypothetical protein